MGSSATGLSYLRPHPPGRQRNKLIPEPPTSLTLIGPQQKTTLHPRSMHSNGRPRGRSWLATLDMPPALAAALYLRDASGLKVKTDFAVPQLEPRVDCDSALIAHATEQAAEGWDAWWSGLLERNPEFRGVPPLVPDPLPELPADLRALISIGLPGSQAWFRARKHEFIEDQREGRPRRPVGKIVKQVEADLGRAAAPFDLLISILPVAGVWGSRVRHDHVLISRALSCQDTEFATFLEPVIRELAA
jgi:hypothetical protein